MAGEKTLAAIGERPRESKKRANAANAGGRASAGCAGAERARSASGGARVEERAGVIARIRCASKVPRPTSGRVTASRDSPPSLLTKCPYTSPEYRVLRVEGDSCRGGSRRGFLNPERVTMLPSLVAAAPARILTSGQLGQPSGASPPSPRRSALLDSSPAPQTLAFARETRAGTIARSTARAPRVS